MFITSTPPPTPPPPVTVWIHGTKASIFLPEQLRPAIEQRNPMLSPSGLHRVTQIDAKYHHVKSLTQVLSQTDPKQFPLEEFYIFGWSGDLDFASRKNAAQELYNSLRMLEKQYKARYKWRPKITLITHSHGGNVALNLARIPQQIGQRIQINRLIMLACPVQKETEDLIDYLSFKKIYSLHSHADLIQVLDPQRLHPFKQAIKEAFEEKSIEPLQQAYQQSARLPMFSERHFPIHSKLIQADIQWSLKKPWSDQDIQSFPPYFANILKAITKSLQARRGLMHIDFILPSFVKELPLILRYLDEQTKNAHISKGDIVVEL